MINEIRLIGNLGQDPEVSFTKNGKAFCRLSVATNEEWTDANGVKQKQTQWHRVVVWGKAAEACGKYLTKGKQVYVAGKMTYREYENKQGNKAWSADVQALTVKFLGGAGGGSRRGDGDPEPQSPDEHEHAGDYDAGPPPVRDDDDIPF